jgi:hypothetical protein
MASSSKRDGAGGKGVGSGSPRKGRASKAAPADGPVGREKRTKRETGVIAVKRAGVLPRQARAARVAVAATAAAPELAAALEEITQVTRLAPAVDAEPVRGALPQAVVVADDTEEMSLDELARLATASRPGPAAQVIAPEEGAPSLAEVVMPPLDVEPPQALPAEPEPAAALPPSSPARTGLGRLVSTLRRWAGARVEG